MRIPVDHKGYLQTDFNELENRLLGKMWRARSTPW